MPDSATLDMGAPASGGKGIPGWIMIVGAIAGVAGLALLLKGGGSGGTTAAGTSINAALGSIQEENMNLLGTTQAGFMQTGQQIGSVNTNLTSGFAGVNTGIAGLIAQITGLQDSLTSQLTGLSTQMTAFSTQTSGQYTALSNIMQNGQSSQDQVNASVLGLLQSIQADVTAGRVSQDQANAAIANLQNSVDTWGQTLALKDDYLAALGNTYLPNIYQSTVMGPHASASVGTH